MSAGECLPAQGAAPAGTDPHDAARPAWVLCLFVAGGQGRSRRAIANLRRLCACHLPPGVAVEVIDIHRNPAAAARSGIAVVPTLLRRFPPPQRRLVGDLSDTGAVLAALDLRPPGEQ